MKSTTGRIKILLEGFRYRFNQTEERIGEPDHRIFEMLHSREAKVQKDWKKKSE